MAYVIITTAISGKSGIDKAVIEIANLLDYYNKDCKIITILNPGEGDKRKFSKSNHFNIRENVKTDSIYNLGFELSNLNLPPLTIKHKYFTYTFTSENLELLHKFSYQLTSDDVILFSGPIAAKAFKFSKGNMKPLKVVQIHCDLETDLENQKEFLSLNDFFDSVQTVSQGVIPFVETKTIKPVFSIYNFSGKYHLNNNEYIDRKIKNISIVGSFQERKGQLDAVKVIEKLNDNYVLNIFGDPSGDYYNLVMDYVKDRNLEHKIKIKGFCNEENIFSQTDLLISCSTSEGFSLTLVEAMSYAIPVVSYDYLYGPKEIIKNNKNGFIVPFGDIKAMTQSVKEIFRNTRKYNEMKNCALESYKNLFYHKALIEKYNDLLPMQNSYNKFEYGENHLRIDRTINSDCLHYTILIFNPYNELLKISCITTKQTYEIEELELIGQNIKFNFQTKKNEKIKAVCMYINNEVVYEYNVEMRKSAK